MKSTQDYQPFFYIIRNTENGMLYAGSRTSVFVDANPDQLLTTYLTSSKTVRALIEAGAKFEVVRTKTFSDAESTLAFESRFLRLYRCVKDKNWYNRHDGRTISPFGCDKYNNALEQKYGYRNAMHIPNVVQKVSENLKGAINCWDEELGERRRVSIEEYKMYPDRYWHIQSVKYRNKYKNGAKLEKFSTRVYYNIYNERNQLVHHKTPKLSELCEVNGYPLVALRNSADRGGERIYWTHVRAAHADDMIKYRGWYAVRVDVNDTTIDHVPIEPVFVSKRKQKLPKPKKEKAPHPTVVLIMKGNEVVTMYRKAVTAVAKQINVDNKTLFSSIETGNLMINGKTRETIATKQGKGWLIGCIAKQLNYDDKLVMCNMDKMVE